MAGEMAAKSPEDVYPVKTFGWAAKDSSGIFSPFKFSRRATGEHDVQFKVLYCGTCDFDRTISKNKFGWTMYPFVFGHEIVGVVTEVGNKVKKFKVGDKVGLGGIFGSCRECHYCTNELENYCPKAVPTDGGCSNIMVADEYFLIHWPENLPLDAGAPLLCAGITAYSPMKRYGLDKPGIRLGIVGLGGIGHMAVKFAKAFGAKVTVISSSPKKKQAALEKLAADSFLVSSDPEEMQAAAATLDGILDTVPVAHPLEPLLALLKPLGKLIMLGVRENPNMPNIELPILALIHGGIILVAGSSIGSRKETQEMVDFAAKHNIVADIEVVPIDYVNTMIERIEKQDVKYRFVIDIGNTLKAP